VPARTDRRVAVGRLRIRAGGGDPLRLRLGVDRLLAAADLGPAGLPPAAILVVRSLADPLPGRLDCRAAVPGPAWQRAVAAALGARAAGAARPASGVAPEHAAAVVFADRAELLACLGRDWCDGSLARRWWWRALGLSGPTAPLQALAETPEAVPAALARLARDGRAAAVAARVPPEAAAGLARAVGAASGTGAAVEAALSAADGSRHASTEPLEASGRPHGRGETEAEPPAPAPWRADLTGAGDQGAIAALAREQEALLGIALALWRRPAAVRSPAFVTAARGWRADRGDGDGPAQGGRAPARGWRATRPEGGVAAREGGEPPRAGDRARTLPGSRPGAERRLRRREEEPRPPARGPEAHGSRRGAQPGSRGAVAPATVSAPDAPRAGEAAAEALATSVRTGLGGLFHLVHVGQCLGLYADFTTPARPGIALPLWDFVALLGGRLLGRKARDPVWDLLAQLEGRAPGEAPGRGYRPPRAWRVPAGWIAPFPARGTWCCAEGDGRVLLRHPAGFAAVDAPGAELGRELRRHGLDGAAAAATSPPRVRRIPAPERTAPARERWLAHLTDYVRARLARALGVPRRRAAPFALRRPAEVHVTDTRVDVVSALADLPIEVRLAGLDRDPGHVPAAGRSLLFHFT
jgi:hypothetical protein